MERRFVIKSALTAMKQDPDPRLPRAIETVIVSFERVVPHAKEASFFMLTMTCCWAIAYAVWRRVDIANGVLVLAGGIYGSGAMLKGWKHRIDAKKSGSGKDGGNDAGAA